MYERTASGKAGDTRVRSLFAREHYAQMDAAMEAKDRELAAAHAEIAMLKKALQGTGKGKGASPRSGVVRGTEPNDARRASGATRDGVEGVAAQACGARGRYGARRLVCARDARLARPRR